MISGRALLAPAPPVSNAELPALRRQREREAVRRRRMISGRALLAGSPAEAVGEVIPDLGAGAARAQVDKTDVYVDQVDAEYYGAAKTKHISLDRYTGWSAVRASWKAFKQRIDTDGISNWNASDVGDQANDYFARARQYELELQRTNPADVINPIPPEPPKPKEGWGEGIAKAATAGAVLVGVVGAVYLLTRVVR